MSMFRLHSPDYRSQPDWEVRSFSLKEKLVAIAIVLPSMAFLVHWAL